MLRDLWDPELLGLGREMHYHLMFMRLRCLRFIYRFVRGRVVLLLVLDTRSGEIGTRCPLPGRHTSRELGKVFTIHWDDLVGAIQEIAPTTLEGVNQRVTELATTVDQEDEIIYSQLDDARHDRALLRARVNMLYRDRPFHRRTALLMEEEARVSRAAWAQSMDAYDQVRSEGISLRTTVMAQQSEIAELQAADRRRQTVISDLLKADHREQRQLGRH
ncbi:hypothetical protein Tco_1485377 [Tanacetum coccineum]